MAETRCERCKGTGYANVARDSGMEDLPMLLKPIGVFQCPTCGGGGRIGLSDEAEEWLRAAIRKMHDKTSNVEGKGRCAKLYRAASSGGRRPERP